MAITPVDPVQSRQNPPSIGHTGSVTRLAATATISCGEMPASEELRRAGRRSLEFGVPLLDLTALDTQHCPRQLIDSRLLLQHAVLPLCQRGSRLILAVTDPGDASAINDIKFHTGLGIDLVLVPASQLQGVLARVLEPQGGGDSRQADWDARALQIVEQDRVSTAGSDPDSPAADEAPVVSLVNGLLLEAMRQQASDIHIEPYENLYRVRLRLDGILRIIATPPISLANRIASRIKVMAHLDISEKKLPQDGRIKLRVAPQRTLDFRVNVLPTLWGEKIVLRLLDRSNIRVGIDALGFAAEQKHLYLQALRRRQGLILVTGPTGSGKSVCLYTGLSILNSSERNISSAEDPVELPIEGINQVCINTRSGYGFADALRAFLRQDPDVVMVGEIRDAETVDVAIKAAQTGHLVLTTLHTNSAAETIARLLNMGVSAFSLATTVNLIIAQRLARRLCTHCKESVDIPAALLQEQGLSPSQFPANKLDLYRAVGCEQCNDGYKGRIGIYEVVPITAGLSQLIMGGASALALARQAQEEGFPDLRASALRLVGQGVTTLDEVNRLG